MGKVFITDEVNDMYTANVTNAGKIQIEDAANLWCMPTSACNASGGQAMVDGALYLKTITLSPPATAGSFIVYDTYSSAGNVSAFGTSGANVVAVLRFPVGYASAGISAIGGAPVTIPLNVYLSSGLTIGNGGHTATDSLKLVGCFKQATITYQT